MTNAAAPKPYTIPPNPSSESRSPRSSFVRVSHEMTQLIATYFHAMREKRRKPMPGEDRLVAGIVERVREVGRLERAADRDAHERSLE